MCAIQKASPAGCERQGSGIRRGIWEHLFVEVTCKPRSACSGLLGPFHPNSSPSFSLLSSSFLCFILFIKLFGIFFISFLSQAPRGSELMLGKRVMRRGEREKEQEGHKGLSADVQGEWTSAPTLALLWNADSGNVTSSAWRSFPNLSYEVHRLFGLCPRGMVAPWRS